MKKIIILLQLAFPVWSYAQIHFEQQLSLEQVWQKAQKEHKYIFVDCYETWCGPCKQMDQEVYPDTALGKFINPLFISIKLQMDSAKGNDEYARSSYAGTKKMATAYRVTAYPTFL